MIECRKPADKVNFEITELSSFYGLFLRPYYWYHWNLTVIHLVFIGFPYWNGKWCLSTYQFSYLDTFIGEGEKSTFDACHFLNDRKRGCCLAHSTALFLLNHQFSIIVKTSLITSLINSRKEYKCLNSRGHFLGGSILRHFSAI